ncbi:MAG: fibro-slime domain-containing protein, partial [Clostridia bacterium]|nr:fibro-slime domain-containing protein [Clostridia bacterium]
PTIGHRPPGDNYVNFPTDGYNSSDYAYVVVDLGGGSDAVDYVTLYPRLASNKYIDIGYVAFFETAAEASAYNTLQQNGAPEVGDTYHMGNNMLYGLLMPNRATMDYTQSTHTMNPNGDVDTFMHGYLGAIQPGSSSESSYEGISSVNIPGGSPYRALVWSKYYNVAGAEYLDVILENGARQQLHGGRARVGLVEPSISASSKNLVYKEKVVDYLAWVLEKSLAVPEQNADGSYNYNFVQGEKLAELGNKDLATVLRENINGGTGTYSDAKSRFNSGALAHPADCDTYYEAAYFLLHSTFTTNVGYGKALNNPYHELQLIETTNAAGEVCYKFSSAYTETAYDSTNGLIYNTQQVDAPGKVSGWGYGMTTYDNHFNPIPNDGYGITGSKALEISGYGTNADLYGRNNYNLSLEGHAQFVYREDANQYFTFTGDDDVYLFINNELALDLGGAHAISEVTIQLKDVAAICGLVDGGVYDFDFYYMERHGTAANFAIETNIQIADPSMVTTKTGYQNGSEVGYNGFIDPALPVNYQFTLQNNGAAALENLTFSDPKLNTYLSADSITLNSETTWSDLLLAHYDADGTVKTYIPKGKLTEAALKDALADGILEGEKLLVFGFKHKVGDGTGGTANEWVDNDDGTHSFPNVVYTTAKVENADRILNGQADYVVRKQNVTIDPFHLYSWGENVVQNDGTTAFVLKGSVNITYAEAIAPIIKAYQSEGLTAPHLTDGTVAITNASGNADSTAVNPRATVDDKNGISHAAVGTGMDSYYYVVTNADNVKYGPVRVDVYTYAVSDNTYVLDYGLAVELNDDQFGFRTNDVLQLDVNAYPTEVVIDSIAATPNYGTFAYDSDKASLTYTPNAIMN